MLTLVFGLVSSVVRIPMKELPNTFIGKSDLVLNIQTLLYISLKLKLVDGKKPD